MQQHQLAVLAIGALLGVLAMLSMSVLRAESAQPSGHYQIAAMGSGLIARLDVRTGQVVICDRDQRGDGRWVFACGRAP